MSSHLNKYWIGTVTFLLLCRVSGGAILATKLISHRPTEIVLNSTKTPDYCMDVFIDGAVANPGFYTTKEDDSLINLIQAAGLKPDANTSQLKIYIPKTDEISSPQKISLNRADTWLLEALPGIGPSKAQAIVDYRNKNGPFRRIEDLLKVRGISESTLDKIRNLITVED